MPSPRIHISSTVEGFEIAAGRAIAAAITADVRERRGCMIALSGGLTPRGVYRRLGDMLTSQSTDLGRTHLVFTDERMVSPDDPSSNYGMIQRELISRVHIPPLNVHRIKGELEVETAAREYERELQGVLPLFAGRCDIIVLGVGEDGHTASLFPGTDILQERGKTAGAVLVPHLAAWRVTLTLGVINRARAVVFLAAGKGKAAIVRKVLANAKLREALPATLVRPYQGSLTWMLDSDSASQLLSEGSSDSGRTQSETDSPGHVQTEEEKDGDS